MQKNAESECSISWSDDGRVWFHWLQPRWHCFRQRWRRGTFRGQVSVLCTWHGCVNRLPDSGQLLWISVSWWHTHVEMKPRLLLSDSGQFGYFGFTVVWICLVDTKGDVYWEDQVWPTALGELHPTQAPSVLFIICASWTGPTCVSPWKDCGKEDAFLNPKVFVKTRPSFSLSFVLSPGISTF